MDLILIRHGVTDWNEEGRVMGRSDVPLNARGEDQAQRLADRLRGMPIERVLSSPQRRARDTAHRIAEPRGLEVCLEPALAEVWVTDWQGKTWDQLRDDPDVLRYVKDPMYSSPAVEPMLEVQRRMVGLAERLRAQCPDTSIALVSHGDPIKVLIAFYLSMEIALLRRLDILPGSASVLRCGRSGVRLVALNWDPLGRSLRDS